jgi:hypothetical protein
MPVAKVDFFWEPTFDFFNVSFSTSQGAPKVTPAWKVRTAPKLPPKPKALPASSTPRPTPRPNINATRFQNLPDDKENPRITDVTDSEEATQPEAVKSPTSAAPKKKIPKLKDTGAAKAKAAPNAAKSKVNGVQ